MLRRYGTTGIYASLDILTDARDHRAATEPIAATNRNVAPSLAAVSQLIPQIRDRWESAWFTSLIEPVVGSS